MRLVVQRVTQAHVRVADEEIARIGQGILLLVGVESGDEGLDLDATARKVAGLRIFSDAEGRMNRSLEEIGGEILLVSQFTLCAETRKGRRPSFVAAAPPEMAQRVFDRLVDAFRQRGGSPQTGVFGAKMAVGLTNDGPVTFVLEVAPPGAVG